MEYNKNRVLTDKQMTKLNKINHKPELEVNEMFRVMNGIENLITLCGDDKDRDGLKDTPFRVMKAFMEYTEGYHENPDEHLRKTFDVAHNEMVIVRDIEFTSLCEHHFALFNGVAHIGYVPNKKVTGLSKFGRLTDGYAKRFQVQERLTTQIADAIMNELEPLGVMVVVEAKHTCMCARGIKKANASTTTSAVRGIFADDSQARNEFLSLISR